MRDDRTNMTRCSVINLTVRLTWKVPFGQSSKGGGVSREGGL